MRKGSKHTPETLARISANRKGKALGNQNAAGTPAWNKGIPNTWYNPKGLEAGRAYWTGKTKPKELIERMVQTRQANGNYVAWNKDTIGKMPPPWNKGKPYLAIRAEKNPRWKGGITGENHQIRNSIEYVNWRRAVIARDNATCQMCGIRPTKFHVDHELPFALFPDLRFEVLNGRVLCIPCHQAIPTNNAVWDMSKFLQTV